MLKDKHSGVAVSQLDTTDKKPINNKVIERVMVVLFIENDNRRVYSEIVRTLENNYLMGQDN